MFRRFRKFAATRAVAFVYILLSRDAAYRVWLWATDPDFKSGQKKRQARALRTVPTRDGPAVKKRVRVHSGNPQQRGDAKDSEEIVRAIRHGKVDALVMAGLKTVGEIREMPDTEILQIQNLGKSSLRLLRETLGLPSSQGVRSDVIQKASTDRE